MKIVGLDISITSTGLVIFELDGDLNVVKKDFRGFVTKKYQDKDDRLLYYKNDNFENYIERTKALQEFIFPLLEGADYASIEDYAFAGKGKTFHIGEFTGRIKERLYDVGASMRLTDPVSLKMFATGNGSADKVMMQQELENHPEWEEDGFPELLENSKVFPMGNKSPTADICDAWWLAKLLQLELKLRRGMVNLQDYPEHVIKTFNRVTKSFPENILVREFLGKK